MINRDPNFSARLTIIRTSGDPTTDAYWDGKVKNLIYNPNTLDWEAATGSTGSGTSVEITNFPATLATTTGQNNIITAINALSTLYGLRLDDSASPITYVGRASIGSSNASAVWQIFKMDTTTGIIITWADSNSNFDNVWDNRASLTYG